MIERDDIVTAYNTVEEWDKGAGERLPILVAAVLIANQVAEGFEELSRGVTDIYQGGVG